jgi:hypothetical protein
MSMNPMTGDHQRDAELAVAENLCVALIMTNASGNLRSAGESQILDRVRDFLEAARSPVR